MRKFSRILGKACLLLAPAMVLGAWATAADAQTGTVKVKVDQLYGYKPNGSPDPSKNKACVDKFKSLEQVVTTTYDINPKTLIMTAKSTFSGKTYNMPPLGIAGQYAFGYFQQPTGNPPIYSVQFSLSLQFSNPVSRVLLKLNADTNCLLTSQKAAPAEMKSSK